MLDKIINSVFSNQTWVGSFSSNFLSSLIVGVGIGGFFVFWLNRRSKQSEKQERTEMIANLIWSEFYTNRKQLDVLIENIPKGKLVIPALETSIWDSIDRQAFIELFNFEDTFKIISIYARTGTINKMYEWLLNSIDWPKTENMSDIDKNFVDVFKGKCEELIIRLDDLRDLVKEKRGFDMFSDSDDDNKT